ncbi:hypothetical protein V8F33_013626 [Rhypophila sp. PSN 637]
MSVTVTGGSSIYGTAGAVPLSTWSYPDCTTGFFLALSALCATLHCLIMISNVVQEMPVAGLSEVYYDPSKWIKSLANNDSIRTYSQLIAQNSNVAIQDQGDNTSGGWVSCHWTTIYSRDTIEKWLSPALDRASAGDVSTLRAGLSPAGPGFLHGQSDYPDNLHIRMSSSIRSHPGQELKLKYSSLDLSN